MALPLDRRDLPQGAPGRAHHLRGRHHRGRGEHRRAARGAGHGDRRVRGRAVLDRVPARPGSPRPRRREAGDQLPGRRLRSNLPRGGDAHEGIKAATARVLSTTWQRCVRHWSRTNGDHASLHFQRNALAHAGKNSRRVVSAFIATAFAQPDHAAAKAQWRLVADQMRGKLPKLATLMDTAEEDVLAYMTGPASHQAAQPQSDRAAERRDQATHGRRRNLSERGIDPTPRRRDPHGA